MFKLEYKFENNIPVFRCNFCGKCEGVIESQSKSPLIGNRGCCWYYPKYNLLNIKNILNLGKEDFLFNLKEKSKISQYYMETTGYFDQNSYDEYELNNIDEDFLNEDNSKCKTSFDSKLHFRKCNFCGLKGCTIDFDLRPHPCNLYLCRRVIELCGDKYKPYSKERKDYFSYSNYFDEILKQNLADNKIDLISDFSGSIELIKSLNIPIFEAAKLEPIIFTFEGNNIPA